MGPVATLTCDRGDRKPFMDFCRFQLSRIPDVVNHFVDHKPVDSRFDLVSRFRKGVKEIREAGIDNVIVVESDDYYQADYISHFDFDQYDFIGWDNSTYYNIKTRRWHTTVHGGPDGHSSLCATGFKISALDGFVWPPDDNLWLDIALWRFARQRNKRRILFDTPCPVIGIKHGMGRYGGRGHVMELKNPDPDLGYLKSRVDSESFEFYSNLKL